MQRDVRVVTPLARRRGRAAGARAGIALALLALACALFKLQVLDVQDYALVARANRLRSVTVAAPRGTIYDRHGRVVAENVVGYRIMLMPAPEDSLRAQLRRLTPVLGLTSSDLSGALRSWKRDPYRPMVVLADASARAVARMEERRFLFPAVLVDEYPKRHYVGGDAVGHFLGYVAEISQRQLAEPGFAGYAVGRMVGQAGLEASYEKTLGGEPGLRFLEVDAVGRIVRWLPAPTGVPALPGRDLQLYLDLDLQRYVRHIFPDSLNGALVALDPRTGGVLAYFASPDFDPNLFTGGVSRSAWMALNGNPRLPLLDRAGGAAQPPGSTYKLAVAAMALKLGVITPDETMPLPCTGGMTYDGRYAHCWDRQGHGYLTLPGAIEKSCDVYFYQVGIRIGLQRFFQEGTRLAYGSRTGIDLPPGQEIASTFPLSTAWWQEHYGSAPVPNEIMSLAIGQSAITVTPLKLAQMYVALARPDGLAPAPRFVQGDSAPPVTFKLRLTPGQQHALRDGMRLVLGPGGTAWLSRLRNWDFMGKTGTAQNPRGPDHALFVGIGGPRGGPAEIVVAVLIEHGRHGSVASGYAADAVNFYLDREHGRPFEPYPTARDRIAHQLPVDWQWQNSPIELPPPPAAATSAPADSAAPASGPLARVDRG